MTKSSKSLTLPWSRRASFLMVSTGAAVIWADVCFYQDPWGWALGGFQLFLLFLLYIKHPEAARRNPLLWLATAGLGFGLIIDYKGFALFLSTALLLGVAALARQARASSIPNAFWAGLFLPFRYPVGLLRDAWVLIKKVRFPLIKLDGILKFWAIPLIFAACFAGLFAIANPVLGHWLLEFSTWTARISQTFFHIINVPRTVYWGVVAAAVWGFFRVRAKRRTAANETTHNPRVALPLESLTAALVIFNVIFAIQNSFDLVYLWGGRALPEGMTYAQYAHRGAYSLVFTAILAAGFTLATFQSGSASENDPRARWLVIGWVGQNLFLLVSAAWRLFIYVEAYGLSRMRLAAAVWMGLVMTGFFLIGLRIATKKTNAWLVGANAAVTTALLYALCFVPSDSMIAWHNVRTCREVTGEGVALDFWYLKRLGPEAIPALSWLATHVPQPEVREKARMELSAQRAKVLLLVENGMAWTVRRQYLAAIVRSQPQ